MLSELLHMLEKPQHQYLANRSEGDIGSRPAVFRRLCRPGARTWHLLSRCWQLRSPWHQNLFSQAHKRQPRLRHVKSGLNSSVTSPVGSGFGNGCSGFRAEQLGWSEGPGRPWTLLKRLDLGTISELFLTNSLRRSTESLCRKGSKSPRRAIRALFGYSGYSRERVKPFQNVP